VSYYDDSSRLKELEALRALLSEELGNLADRINAIDQEMEFVKGRMLEADLMNAEPRRNHNASH